MIKKLSLLLLSASLFFFVGCGDDDSNNARLRVFHGSPDAPAVDVLVDQEILLTALAYLQSSGYVDIENGERRIQVNATGTETTVIDAVVELVDDQSYTVLAINFLASIEPLVLVDQRNGPGSGLARLRVVHGAPSAPEVDVYVTAPGADLSSLSPTLSGVPFRTNSGYLEVESGDYQVRVTLAGTTTVVIDTGTITLESDSVSTAVAVDNEGGGAPFSVVLLSDS